MISRQAYNQPKTITEFSLPENSTAHRVLVFIKNSLPEFEKEFKQANLQIYHEDEISGQLCLFFNDKASNQDLLFNFNARIGVDFTIYVSPFQLGSQSIFMIEAKRLSRHHYDYVRGRNGGIERFKREQEGFGEHLKISAMIGYIQDETIEYWENKINNWIDERIKNKIEITWKEEDKLVPEGMYSYFTSNHLRVSNTSIRLYHYWISLN